MQSSGQALTALILVLGLTASPAQAADLWTAVRPGVDWLHRSTGGGTPQEIQAVRIDLSLGAVGIRASRDAAGTERGVGTDTFAANVGALVAIGGDWSNGYTPVGLAIGNGFLWNNHYSDPNIGATWGTFGCDVWNGCTIDALPPLPDVWWYSPTIAPLRYYNAVGTNGLLMLDDGVPTSGCFDGCPGDSCRNPRSLVCLEQDNLHLWFIAVDGRRAGASGMTCGEARALAMDLGCWDAAMLDGGGSTSLWVDGAIRNQPSDGSPRPLGNHVGIVYTETPDPACPFDSGAWCEGAQLRTCNGGQLVNEGDCAAFGATCQEDEDWAFCVHPFCPGGDGNNSACVDDVTLDSCTDGVYSSGDCSVFGLVCGSDTLGSGCMDAACSAGPNSGFCATETTAALCVDGLYEETTCDAGSVCWVEDTTSSCMDARCAEGPNQGFCIDSDTLAVCNAGTYEELSCPPTQSCEAQNGSATCVDPSGDDDDSSQGGDDDDSGGGHGGSQLPPPDPSPVGDDAGCACSTNSPPNPSRETHRLLLSLFVCLAVPLRRRRRR